ncbi:CAP domain-containing protein [Nonomuraea sp. MCN248]|uniref:CAP domain-containing protein n=1 Tax=Nonomuraea corallina TaxID=2989783 RepID=A0ABT4S6Q7_9ACTN|nr:CAP domain-containing protein [Nonomuraea corallina]MDA0632874.1 CAP domain-containing protein [Nonomuraea corallina]
MRRPLGVLACLASAAALSAPVATANAATVPQPACRVSVAKPRLAENGTIKATAALRDCHRPGLVRMRILRAVPGKDRVVKSGAERGRNPRLTLAMPCAPGTYYVFATDYRGHTGKSRAVRVTACDPAATPVPTTTATTPAPAPTRTATATPKPVPTTTRTPAPTLSATPTPSSPSGTVGTAEENEVVRLTNAERAKGGCPALKHDPQLNRAAAGHSADMAAKNYLSHTSQDGRSFLDRIRQAGFTGGRGWAENIAMGQRTPADVVRAWMNSSGHRANIMNCSYNLIGAGAAKNAKGQFYWTQNFAAR